MGSCSSSSSSIAPSELLVVQESPQVTVNYNFHQAIRDQNYDQLRILIKEHGSKLITPLSDRFTERDEFMNAAQMLLVATFEKLIELEGNVLNCRDHEKCKESESSAIANPEPNASASDPEPLPAPIPEPALVTATEHAIIVSERSVENTAAFRTDRYSLHAAARVGCVEELLLLCMHDAHGSMSGGGVDNSRVWVRDEFDNIPLYYACLNGHPLCCAWLLVAMRCGESAARFAVEVPAIEMERFVINALNADIKALLKEKIDCKDYIKANTTKKVKTVEVSNITTTVQQQQTLNNDGTEAEAVTEVVIEEEEDDDYGDAMSRLFG